MASSKISLEKISLKVGLADYTSAYQWILKRKYLLLVENKYFVPAGVETGISKSEVKAFWKTHTAQF